MHTCLISLAAPQIWIIFLKFYLKWIRLSFKINPVCKIFIRIKVIKDQCWQIYKSKNATASSEKSHKILFFKFYCHAICTHLKNNIESNSAWEDALIKVNQLKLTQIEIDYFFHFMYVAANASELFCMAYLANSERFLYHSNLLF